MTIDKGLLTAALEFRREAYEREVSARENFYGMNKDRPEISHDSVLYEAARAQLRSMEAVTPDRQAVLEAWDYTKKNGMKFTILDPKNESNPFGKGSFHGHDDYDAFQSWFDKTLRQCLTTQPAMQSVPGDVRRWLDFKNLPHGHCIIHWTEEHGGGSSVGLVGSMYDGTRWFSCANWTVASTDWSRVAFVDVLGASDNTQPDMAKIETELKFISNELPLGAIQSVRLSLEHGDYEAAKEFSERAEHMIMSALQSASAGLEALAILSQRAGGEHG